MAACSIVGPLRGSLTGTGPMVGSAAISAGVGALLLLIGRKGPPQIGRREALVIVAASWLGTSVFGGLPFILGASFTPWDAFFETVSGFTTTGASILPEIEQRLSPPLHMWRLATHWLGGLGIVVLFVALFPALGVGGKHLFRTEATGPSGGEGLAPRIRDTAVVLWRVYVALTALQVAMLMLAGMDWFEALGHAFATMGTGGFSTRNTSIAAFDSLAIDVIITFFMMVAGANFALFHEAMKRGPRALWDNVEFKVYLGIFLAVSALITMDLYGTIHAGLGTSIRHSAFQVASIMTTTGFMTDDFERWPTFSQTLLVFLYFVGGSAGSTAGGLKVIRVVIVLVAIRAEIRRGFRPSLVAPVRVGRMVVAPPVVAETLAFVAVYLLTIGVIGVLVALFDRVDITTAFMASLTCVANVGPGLGMVGPTENFAFFSPASKMLLSFGMLLGRLEFFALLALFVPSFWKR